MVRIVARDGIYLRVAFSLLFAHILNFVYLLKVYLLRILVPQISQKLKILST